MLRVRARGSESGPGAHGHRARVGARVPEFWPRGQSRCPGGQNQGLGQYLGSGGQRQGLGARVRGRGPESGRGARVSARRPELGPESRLRGQSQRQIVIFFIFRPNIHLVLLISQEQLQTWDWSQMKALSLSNSNQ